MRVNVEKRWEVNMYRDSDDLLNVSSDRTNGSEILKVVDDDGNELDLSAEDNDGLVDEIYDALYDWGIE